MDQMEFLHLATATSSASRRGSPQASTDPQSKTKFKVSKTNAQIVHNLYKLIYASVNSIYVN